MGRSNQHEKGVARMSNEHPQPAPLQTGTANPTVEGPPYVQLFQKAHQHIVMLDHIDEQLNQLIAKRTELQEELRMLQQQINDELEDRISGLGEQPGSLLGAVAAAGAASATSSSTPPTAQRAHAGSNRFANQSLTTLANE